MKMKEIKMICPACGAKLKKTKDLLYDDIGEIKNGEVYRCIQCAVQVLVPF
jgi:uncharacterized Zn finger protein